MAALLFPAFAAVKRHAIINRAETEMAQIETAIDRYKAAYGFYPPSNTNTFNDVIWARTNQLYFELSGTTNNGAFFQTLENSAQVTPNIVSSTFGVGGFINCNKSGMSEDTPTAKNFLPDLKPNQIATLFTNADGSVVNIIVGSDDSYSPLGTTPQLQGVNPWRYNSYNPVNNPGAYDLWLQVVISGKTNLICNWSKQVQINAPLP
ncbi:MAG TPA: hypothetical protein VHG71_09190 [Verrucomicrobiae bacterium]|nr:hypothetical protein [Verrucomicrobiae bacterium]